MQNAFLEVVKGENLQPKFRLPEEIGSYIPPGFKKSRKPEPGDSVSEKLQELKSALPEEWAPNSGGLVLAKINEGERISGIEQGVICLEAYIQVYTGVGVVDVDDIDKAINAVRDEAADIYIGSRLGITAGQVVLLEKLKLQVTSEFYQVIGLAYFIQGHFKEARATAVGKVEDMLDPFSVTAPAFNQLISGLKTVISNYVAHQLTFAILGYRAPMEHMFQIKNGMELAFGRLYTSIIEFCEVAPIPEEEKVGLIKEMSLCFMSSETPQKGVLAPMNWAYPTEERVIEALNSIKTKDLPLINTGQLRSILSEVRHDS
jgi:hypothetical protein